MSPEVQTESRGRKENATVSWELLIENTSNGTDISTMIVQRVVHKVEYGKKNKTFPEKHQIQIKFLKINKNVLIEFPKQVPSFDYC